MSESVTDLDGVWQMVRAELDGEVAPDLVAQRTALEFSRGRYAVSFEGMVIDQGTFDHDPSGRIKTLKLVGESGPNSRRTIRCIYKHAGERLRVCYGLDGLTPATFATRAGQNRYLATYRRFSGRPPSPSPM